MAWKIMWTESAWIDLENIARYIAEDSPYYAASFVREIKEAARSLEHFAERGRIVPEVNNPYFRELFIGNYRLIYQITKEIVYILTFIHGMRNLNKKSLSHDQRN